MADRIGIIAKGKLIAEGTLTELQERASAGGLTLEDIFLEIVNGETETSALDNTATTAEEAAV